MTPSTGPRHRAAALVVIAALLAASVVVCAKAYMAVRVKPIVVAYHYKAVGVEAQIGRLRAPLSACSIAISPDGKTILVGSINLTPVYTAANPGISNPGRLSSFDARTLKRIASVTAATGVAGIELSRQGNLALISGGTIGPFRGLVVNVPRLSSGTLGAHGFVTDLELSYRRLAAVPEWYRARRAEADSMRAGIAHPSAIPFIGPVPSGCSVSLSDGLIAASNEYYAAGPAVSAGSSYIYIVDCRSGSTLQRIRGPLQSSLAFAERGSEIIGRAAASGRISAWSCRTGRRKWSADPSDGSFDGIVSSPDGAMVLAYGSARFALFDAGTGRLLDEAALDSGYPAKSAQSTDLPQRCAFSPDGRRIYICCSDGVHVFPAPKPASRARGSR